MQSYSIDMMPMHNIHHIEIPLSKPLPSLANMRLHHMKLNAIKKAQKYIIDLYCTGVLKKVKLPCSITLTRCAPRLLDDDNLAFAFKAIRDRIAQILFPKTKSGQADNNPQVKWNYFQISEKTPKIMIDIELI